MNAGEYKAWLKENANQEEAMAWEVAQKVLWYHKNEYAEDVEVEYFPRYLLVKGKERIEFDLLIRLRWKTEVMRLSKKKKEESNEFRTYERLIGIEFKELDIKKVLMQAVRRSIYVDYMYIATANTWLDYEDVFILAYFGIGWVVWGSPDGRESGFVKLITPSKYMVQSRTLDRLLSRAIDTLVEDKIKKKIEEMKQQTLSGFFGDEDG